jgi:SAM-dependent MidA family methyltransferase
MDEALYHPTSGFYASGKTRTGKEGDFLTPVSPGPVLGQLLARQADELHHVLGRPPSLNLIEQGADAGWLARDLLGAIQRNHPKLTQAVRLHLIEPHPKLAETQRTTLTSCTRSFPIQWHPSLKEFSGPSIPSLFYSSELVDSFPIRIFSCRSGTWREKVVGWEDSRFVWQEQATDPATRSAIAKLSPPAVEGFTFEIRPGVAPWLQTLAAKISQGLILTLDYGFVLEELFSPARAGGTLVSLRNHQRTADPLADPGEQDLTAHVNFTELEELGSQEGLKSYGLTNFARGLTSLATPLLNGKEPLSESWIRNFRHLTHPPFFGHSHKILVQGKSLPESFQPLRCGGLGV